MAAFRWYVGLFCGSCFSEAASGGAIALVEDGDEVVLDIPNRGINLSLSQQQLEARAQKQQQRGKDA